MQRVTQTPTPTPTQTPTPTPAPLVRRARTEDLAQIMRLLGQARAFQHRQGNPQWADGYPPENLILREIAQRRARVLVAPQGEVWGYASIVPHDEGYAGVALPADTAADRPWCAIHRIALADRARGRGLARLLLRQVVQEVCGAGMREVRIDTGERNRAMQHLATSLGFEALGLARFPWGDRLVYRYVAPD